MKNYYIKQGDSFAGPFKNWQVLEKYEKGEINEDTLVRHDKWDTPKEFKKYTDAFKNLKIFLGCARGGT